MRLLVLAGLLALVCAGGRDGLQETNFKCPDDGLFSDPEDCHMYYKCQNSFSWLMSCGELVFYPSEQTCDWNRGDICQKARQLGFGTQPQPNPTPSGWFKCPKPNGSFRDPYDCSVYFVCEDNIAWQQHCPANLVFNPAKDLCDYAIDVQPPCVPASTPPPLKKMSSRRQHLRGIVPSAWLQRFFDNGGLVP